MLGLGWALQPNTGALAGLPDVRGYDLPVSVDTERLMGALRSPPSRPWFALERLPSVNLLHWMGVRAVVSTQPLARGEPLDLGLSPLHAARVSGASTRAWVATAPTAVDTPEDAIGRLLDADRAQPPVEHLPGRWPKTGRMYPASWVVDSPGELVLETQAPEKGLLVIADAWHPGWKASVDDVPVPCLRVGGVFRGVVISPGVHTVRLVFEPWGWRVGGLLGLLGVFLLVVLTLRTILWRR